MGNGKERPDVAMFGKAFKVTDGKGFKLADCATQDAKAAGIDKDDAKKILEDGIARLSELQERLYADDHWSVLLIFQAMDAAGKDGTIKHVMSGVNPQGCQVHAFKAPSHEELDHDFLWRTTCRMPERGRIGIFNRSYYEEVLVVRVHPEILAGQRLPPQTIEADLWRERLESIADFERHMARNGTRILKFFLNVSRKEQKRRLLERIDDTPKNWKFDSGDLAERARWKDYMAAYEDAIRNTATKQAPWYIIPADDKWFMRAAVMAAIITEMETLDLRYPELDAAGRAKLLEARKQLTSE